MKGFLDVNTPTTLVVGWTRATKKVAISKSEELAKISSVAIVHSVHREPSGARTDLLAPGVQDSPEGPEDLENPVVSFGTESAPEYVSSKFTCHSRHYCFS